MKAARIVIPVTVFALHACGGAQTPSGQATVEGGSAGEELPADDDQVLVEYDARAGDLATRLDATLPSMRPDGESLSFERAPERGQPLTSGPDCDAARSLRDEICALADRICSIADRRPAEVDVRAKCDDAHDRCAGARAKVTAACGD